jgi:hypothetical protein
VKPSFQPPKSVNETATTDQITASKAKRISRFVLGTGGSGVNFSLLEKSRLIS